MRTTMAAIAALAAVASVNAAPPAFDKADCSSMSSNAFSEDIAGVANGAWSCVNFDAALDSQQLVKLTMAPRWLGWELQVMLWNDGQIAGDTAANTWRDSAAGRGVLTWIKPQNGVKDIQALPTSFGTRYSNISNTVGLTVVNGWTGDIVNYRDNGVYSMYGAVTPAPGLNTFIISNPDASSPGGSFGGVFMYRLVDTTVLNSVSDTVAGTLSAAQVNAHWGKLGSNSPLTVSNVLRPGMGVQVPISDAWATTGWAIRGLKYTVSISPGGSTANAAKDQMGWAHPLPFPTGWDTTDGWERSFTSPSPGSVLKSGNAFKTAANQHLWYDYSAGDTAFGAYNGTQTYADNAISIDWKYPLDVDSSTSSSSFGFLTIQVPLVQNDADATIRPYDWSGQSSPFWDITITLDRVDEYPMLGSESNVELVNKNNVPADGHSHASVATDPATGPFKIYRVGTSNPLWWRMIVNFNNVVNKNLPAGVTEETAGCEPQWDFQIVQDANDAHNRNGWGETWYNLNSPPGGYHAEDFWASNAHARASLVDSAKGWLTNDEWRDGERLPGSARDALLPKLPVGRNTWMLVRVSAAPATVESGLKSCGSNHVTIGSMSASWDTVDDQCKDYSDCLVATADNPNADQDGDSANNNARRFSNCIIHEAAGGNYRWIPTTKCVECFASYQCGEGQYCHLDSGSTGTTWGPYTAAFVEDSDSAKLFGTCQRKSSDVLGKRCRILNSGGSRATGYFPVAGTGSAVAQAAGSDVRSAGARPTDLLVAVKGDADNADYAEGAYGACGEFRFSETRAPGEDPTAPDNQPDFINGGAGGGLVRTALWTGFCDSDQICRECVPGSTGATTGKVCLNGRSFSAMDVDNTVRSFGQNTVASTELGTTAMVILLIILFAAYMYTEATRWRHANGLPPMTCCECLCCCGCCSKLGGEAAAPASSGKTAPAPAAAPEA